MVPWWCYVGKCCVDRSCVFGEGVKQHDDCEVRTLHLWSFARFSDFVLWVVTWFRRKVYGVYVHKLANICTRCVVIIHGHWLALMHGA